MRGPVYLSILIVLALILTLVVIRHASRRSRDEFLGTLYYAPSCGSEWLGRRRELCRGITTGVMPSIETASVLERGLCCGSFGVPP